jgi:hypothetical protein
VEGGATHPGKNSSCQISLQVKRVISGQLPDDYVNRPFGVRNLRVIALSPLPSVIKPAEALGKLELSPVSQWTMKTLPNGFLIVDEYSDAWKAGVRQVEEQAVALQKELRSGDSKRQYQALRQLREITAFTLFA